MMTIANVFRAEIFTILKASETVGETTTLNEGSWVIFDSQTA